MPCEVLSALLEFMVLSIVDRPAHVTVESFDTGRCVVLELSVSKFDMPRIHGRGGSMAKALRTILLAAALKFGKDAVLRIVQ